MIILLFAVMTFSAATAVHADQDKSPVASTPVVEITGEKPVEEEFEYEYVEIESDPLEPVNRGIFAFNEVVDDVLVEPVARGYKAVVPKWGQERVGNFFDNLSSPVTFLNSILQGDVENAFATFWRFVINSTVGIGGLFDQAEIAGLSARNEDFGQTLGHYGSEPGAYIVLPLLGPSTTRDAFGLVVDSVSNPFNYVTGDVIIGKVVTESVHERSELLELTDEIEQTSFDPYATYKSAYMQRRLDLVKDGKR